MATIVVKWHSFKCKEIKRQKLGLLYEHKIRSHLANQHRFQKQCCSLEWSGFSVLDSRVSYSKPTSWIQSGGSHQRYNPQPYPSKHVPRLQNALS